MGFVNYIYLICSPGYCRCFDLLRGEAYKRILLLVSETFAATITIVVVVVARIPSRSRRILHLVPSRIQLEKDPVVQYTDRLVLAVENVSEIFEFATRIGKLK